MLNFLKSVLFCLCVFSSMAAAYGYGLKDVTLVLNSLMLALPCGIVLTLLTYLKV